MNPKDKLNEIKATYDAEGICFIDSAGWLIARVEQIETALKKLSYESYSNTPPFKPDCACHTVADKALVTMP